MTRERVREAGVPPQTWRWPGQWGPGLDRGPGRGTELRRHETASATRRTRGAARGTRHAMREPMATHAARGYRSYCSPDRDRSRGGHPGLGLAPAPRTPRGSPRPPSRVGVGVGSHLAARSWGAGGFGLRSQHVQHCTNLVQLFFLWILQPQNQRILGWRLENAAHTITDHASYM